ncbi:MAG TPA: GAF domain-containing protein, partial [Anaerolineae bacterium]
EARQALILKASTGLAATSVNQARLQLGEGITGYAARSGKPVAVRDAAHDLRFKYLPETHEQDYKSLLAVPLMARGSVIGAINVQTRTFHRYTQPEIELLSLIGDLAAGALERAALHDHLQRQLQELSTLAEVSKTITAPIYLDQMLSVVVEMAAQIMRARACALLLYDEERRELVVRAAHGLSQGHLEGSPLQVQNSLTGRVVMTGQPVMVRDVRNDPLYQYKELARAEGLLSFLAVPLQVRDKVIGAFNCYMGAVHEFSRGEIELFSTLANQTALAIENANLAMNALLVREMHHRVKNNLQMVAMLLRLQMREANAVPTPLVLKQTINRILGIAAVHEALSREGFRLIGVRKLLQQVALIATQNQVQGGRDLQVVIEGSNIRLPSQPATSLAMAANELVQNALEHAFPADGSGKVVVSIAEEPEGFCLEVRDDGVGLPPRFDKKTSLGLQIVEMLVTEDLHGDFRLSPNSTGRGTAATIRIPRSSLER